MKKSVLRGRPDLINVLSAYDDVSISEVFKLTFKILNPEKPFYFAAVIYGIAISILTLAAPISVQTLITTVANTAQLGQVIVLAVSLFILLGISGAFFALQTFIMELFKRKFFARITSEISLQNIYAKAVYYKSINRSELMNRYFDIMTVQNNLPSLLTNGIALILQSVVGLLVVSFYHPAFLIFNFVFILSLYLVWRIWGHRAIKSGLAMSNAKYNVAHWLEEMARANDDFKPHNKTIFALQKSEQVTHSYINMRKVHFKHSFAQVIGLTFIYALFSSVLLGLGGWLVIRGELSLGQLVAAELILTAIFFGISQAGQYLMMLYELVPAIEKISHFFRIPLEIESGVQCQKSENLDIIFDNARSTFRNRSLKYDLVIPQGSKILVASSSHVLQEYFIDFLKGHRIVEKGAIYLGSQDISDLNLSSLRETLYVVDDDVVLEGTIEEYLQFAKPGATKAEMNRILELVHLKRVVDELEEGYNTHLTHNGYPLSQSETIRLKLAASLLIKPPILIMTELFDVVGYHIRLDILKTLQTFDDLTFILFTNRRDADFFEKYLYLTEETDMFVDGIEELRSLIPPGALKYGDEES